MTGAVFKHFLFNFPLTPGELLLAVLSACLIAFGAVFVIVQIAASLVAPRKPWWS